MAYVVDGLNYDKRYKLDLQTTNLDANVTDFTSLIQVANDSNMADANADGFDIRFTASDETTLLKYERESWTGGNGTNVTANLWVKSSLATAGTTIYMYWRSTDTADGADPANTWNSNFKAVYHMSEASWNGTAGEVKDSTGNNNGVRGGGATTNASKIYRGGTFDGADDYVNAGTNEIVNVGSNMSISVWIKPDNLGESSVGRIFFKRSSESTTAGFNFLIAATNTFGLYVDGGTDLVRYANANSISIGNWNYLTVTWDGGATATNVLLYKNGVVAPSYQTTTNGVTLGSTSGGGYTNYIGMRQDSNREFDGDMDELRFSNAIKTAAWIKFEYYNMANADNEFDRTYQTATVGYAAQLMMCG